MVFMPHGMDQMFWEANGPLLPNFGGLVASAVIHTPEGHRLYRQRLAELFHEVYRLDILTNRLEQLHSRNRPAVAEIGRGAVANYDNAVKVVRDRIVERWMGVKMQLDAQPATLSFDHGAAKLTGWSERDDSATGKLDRIRNGGRSALHIAAAGGCTASWRTRVLLDGGSYLFEGQARSAGVVPLSDGEKGEGAGLRISGSTRHRANKLVGESSWRKLEFEFEVAPPGNTVELICELRAIRGEVWFDVDSLNLVRLH